MNDIIDENKISNLKDRKDFCIRFLQEYAEKYLLEKYNIYVNLYYLINSFDCVGDLYPVEYHEIPPQKGERIMFSFCEYKIINSFIYRQTGPNSCHNYVRSLCEELFLDDYYFGYKDPTLEKTKEIVKCRIDEFCKRLVIEKDKEWARNKIKKLELEKEKVSKMYEI
jgi:hypothetical protein